MFVRETHSLEKAFVKWIFKIFSLLHDFGANTYYMEYQESPMDLSV